MTTTAAGSAPLAARPWQAAKTALTQAARVGGGGGRRERVRSAAGAYVRARGGARVAASAATSGRSVASSVGGFFATLATQGVDAALHSLNLDDFVGRSAEEVFAAIADALSPDGAVVEDAAARAAVDQVLGELYDRVEASGGDLAVLDDMVAAEVVAAIERYIAAYVYERWVGDLGLSIERGAVSEATAVELEREMRGYVRELVRLEVAGADPLSLNWAVEGRAIIERVFQDAYSFLEATG